MSATTETPSPRPARPALLMVEDDGGLRTLIGRRLEREGWAVTACGDVASALATAEGLDCPLLLLDYALPDGTAADIVHGLREKEGDCAPLFVVMTGQGDERIAVDMLRLGAADYVIKDGGFLDNLHRVLERVVREDRQAKLLEETMARLERSNRDLEQFAYVASHDLVEPLRKIRGFGEILMREPDAPMDAKRQDYLRRMCRGAERMQGLIDNLLQLSRVTTRGRPLRRIALAAEVAAVLDDLETRIRNEGADVCVGPLPEVSGDATQIRQLFQNLVQNALKFRHPERPCRVEISARTGARWIEVDVGDNGIGFAPEDAERVFEVFRRLHGVEEYEGTGMGLTICRRIAERHGGSIVASGEPGAGAVFTIRLPAA